MEYLARLKTALENACARPRPIAHGQAALKPTHLGKHFFRESFKAPPNSDSTRCIPYMERMGREPLPRLKSFAEIP